MCKGLAIVVLSLVVGLSGCNRARGIAPDIRPEEYDAFSGYLAYTFTGWEKNHEKLILFHKTQSAAADSTAFGGPVPWHETAEFLRQEAPSLQPATIDSYLKANTQQALLGGSLRSPIDYKLVDSAERDSYCLRESGVSIVMTWSRVGFSPDGTQALFYESYHFGRLNSTGRYIVMDRENARWTVRKEIALWSSIE